ncbi:MAG: selenium-dependent xanthine dehydrogenase [Bacillota bacterium]|nr:selenium-dependent xanthine dehydrogenase [Bacillota bacterium]
MVAFSLNGQPVATTQQGDLLHFLRDGLHLTAVKDGCSEGACGACTVLVDGRARQACALPLSALDGCTVLTPEGLTDDERELYAAAFAACGAVQCGFCIPGMIMSAKALLDRNASPTRAEVRTAIRRNICRCTGYQKIIKAILLAAAVRRGEAELPDVPAVSGVGAAVPRPTAKDKARGNSLFVDDMYAEGMLYGSALRSAYPRAIVLSVDAEAARALPGVACVLTAADVPGANIIGHLKKDYPVLIAAGEQTHFLGDAIALIAADSPEAVEQAKLLIKVEYEPLPPLFSAEQAMLNNDVLLHDDGNLLTHQRLRHGQPQEQLARAAYRVSNIYHLPPTEHGFLETEAALALPAGGGFAVTVYSGDQGVYQTRRELAEMLGLPEEQVRVIAAAVGGGFGGKEDMSVQHHAALLAYHTRRPVKVRLSRDESMLIHPKRHAMTIEMTSGCDENGILLATTARLISDTGAYASLGTPVLQRACTHAAGPYNYQHSEIEGFAYYTNNPPAGAFRGFGVTQSCFAMECNLNQLAELAGISGWEIRWRNAVAAGDMLPNGQLAAANTALKQTLLAVKPFYDAHPGAGIACAFKNSGLGVGVPDTGRALIRVEDGQAVIYCSAAGIGQGLDAALTQIAVSACGLPQTLLRRAAPDTALAPDSGNTTASRQTVFSGEAVRRAAAALGAALQQAGGRLTALEGREFYGEFTAVTDPIDCDKDEPQYHIAYSYATHVTALDEQGRVTEIVAAHDVGTAINPQAVEGQIEGGVLMGMGYALTEDMALEQGKPSVNYGRLGLLRAEQAPLITALIVDNPDIDPAEPAYGAKGVGEISAIPTAAALQNAYYKRDGLFRTSLPLTGTAYKK